MSSVPFPASPPPRHQSTVETRQPASMSYGQDDQAASVHPPPGPERTRRRQWLSSTELYRRTFRDDSRNAQSTVGVRQPASMPYGQADQAASVEHHPGPVRTRRRQQLSPNELYRRTLRDDSRNARTAPYETGRARTARPIAKFEEADVHGMTAHEPPERFHRPTGAYNRNMEVERFLSRTDLRDPLPSQISHRTVFKRSTSAPQRSPSPQTRFYRAPSSHQSSFDTMVDRMVTMLAEEDIRASHDQVRDMVLRLQQPSISDASLAMEEDTAERNEARQSRRFHR